MIILSELGKLANEIETYEKERKTDSEDADIWDGMKQ